MLPMIPLLDFCNGVLCERSSFGQYFSKCSVEKKSTIGLIFCDCHYVESLVNLEFYDGLPYRYASLVPFRKSCNDALLKAMLQFGAAFLFCLKFLAYSAEMLRPSLHNNEGIAVL